MTAGGSGGAFGRGTRHPAIMGDGMQPDAPEGSERST